MKSDRNKKQKKKKGMRLLDWILVLGFLAGAGILFYPTLSDLWNRYRSSLLITEYGKAVEGLAKEDCEELWKSAEEYNEEHRINAPAEVFGEDYVLSHPYDSMLDPSGDGIMGSIEIPKIDVRLAIYHGIGADVLEKGCGHVEGTSLPIGGKGCHAALAAHRGLPSARLFTDLDQLEPGDRFYLKILDRTMVYEVDQIKVVLPGDAEELAIIENADYVTLITCTPYGVNTHRLLVRGVRREWEEEEKTEPGREKEEDMDQPVRYLLAGLAGVVCLLVIMAVIAEKRRKKL